MAAETSRDDGRKVNVKLILFGLLGVVLMLFALLNTHEVGVDWLFNTWSAPMILVIAVSAVIGFAMGFLVRGHLANKKSDGEAGSPGETERADASDGDEAVAPRPAGEDASRDVGDPEHEESADRVEEVVVGGDDDHRHRRDRIDDCQRLGPVVFHAWNERAGAPERPRAVHAGHRRELVGDLVDGPRVERPERGVLGQRVNEPVVAEVVEEPRRQQREERETDERERGGDAERVAPARVVVGPPAVEVDHHATGHDEMQRAVEVVGGDDEGARAERPCLDGLLVVDTQRLLEPDDVEGVLVRLVLVAVVQVPHERVHEVEEARPRGSRPTSRGGARRAGSARREAAGGAAR